MTRQQLIEALSEKEGISVKEAKKLVQTLFKAMTDSLANGDRVEIRDFGTFHNRFYKSYVGRNPMNGDAVSVPEKKIPFFKVGKDLKKRVNKNYVHKVAKSVQPKDQYKDSEETAQNMPPIQKTSTYHISVSDLLT